MDYVVGSLGFSGLQICDEDPHQRKDRRFMSAVFCFVGIDACLRAINAV